MVCDSGHPRFHACPMRIPMLGKMTAKTLCVERGLHRQIRPIRRQVAPEEMRQAACRSKPTSCQGRHPEGGSDHTSIRDSQPELDVARPACTGDSAKAAGERAGAAWRPCRLERRAEGGCESAGGLVDVAVKDVKELRPKVDADALSVEVGFLAEREILIHRGKASGVRQGTPFVSERKRRRQGKGIEIIKWRGRRLKV